MVVKIVYNNDEEHFSKMGDNTNKDTYKKWGIVQIGGKCSENKINSKWGISQKIWGNFHMRHSGFKNGVF